MTIKYSDGRSVEAVLLSRMETTIRVAIEGTEDAMEFSDISAASEINGTWVSADCGPVLIEFVWQRPDRKPAASEADCCCSSELAARLIDSLFAGSEDRMEGDASADSRPFLTAATY